MSLDKSHVIVGLASAAIVTGIQFLTFGATYGRLTESVEQLGRRLAVLEGKAMPGVRKGDLCLKLMDAQVRIIAGTSKAQEAMVEAQLQKLGCYDQVPANASYKSGGPGEGNASHQGH